MEEKEEKQKMIEILNSTRKREKITFKNVSLFEYLGITLINRGEESDWKTYKEVINSTVCI